MTRRLWINQSVRLEGGYQKAERGRIYLTQGQTKKEVWAERIMMDKMEDVQKKSVREERKIVRLEKECEQRRVGKVMVMERCMDGKTKNNNYKPEEDSCGACLVLCLALPCH